MVTPRNVGLHMSTTSACAYLVSHSLGQQCLARARLSVEDDALGRLDPDVVVQLRVRQGQLDGLYSERIGRTGNNEREAHTHARAGESAHTSKQTCTPVRRSGAGAGAGAGWLCCCRHCCCCRLVVPTHSFGHVCPPRPPSLPQSVATLPAAIPPGGHPSLPSTPTPRIHTYTRTYTHATHTHPLTSLISWICASQPPMSA
jgi:hypothetical protein